MDGGNAAPVPLVPINSNRVSLYNDDVISVRSAISSPTLLKKADAVATVPAHEQENMSPVAFTKTIDQVASEADSLLADITNLQASELFKAVQEAKKTKATPAPVVNVATQTKGLVCTRVSPVVGTRLVDITRFYDEREKEAQQQVPKKRIMIKIKVPEHLREKKAGRPSTSSASPALSAAVTGESTPSSAPAPAQKKLKIIQSSSFRTWASRLFRPFSKTSSTASNSTGVSPALDVTDKDGQEVKGIKRKREDDVEDSITVAATTTSDVSDNEI